VAAVEVFTGVVELAPEYAEGWNKRATALYKKGDFECSLQDYDKVLSLKPPHFDCLYGKGICLMSLGKGDSAAEAFKQALAVHPGMNCALKALDDLERTDNIEMIMYPRVEHVTSALTNVSIAPDTWYPWDLDGGNNGLAVSWDVHQLAGLGVGDDALVYFFRVSVQNKGFDAVPIRSLSRFYVLRFESGLVFQCKRLTDAASEFWLEPGEEYNYSWIFAVGKAQTLTAAQGGILLERPSKAKGTNAERFVAANLDFMSVSDAPRVEPQQLSDLAKGHNFMGQFEINVNEASLRRMFIAP